MHFYRATQNIAERLLLKSRNLNHISRKLLWAITIHNSTLKIQNKECTICIFFSGAYKNSSIITIYLQKLNIKFILVIYSQNSICSTGNNLDKINISFTKSFLNMILFIYLLFLFKKIK